MKLIAQSKELEPTTAAIADRTLSFYTQTPEDFFKALAARPPVQRIEGKATEGQLIQGFDYVATGSSKLKNRTKQPPQSESQRMMSLLDQSIDSAESFYTTFNDNDNMSDHSMVSHARYTARGDKDIQSSVYNALATLPSIMDAVADSITGHPDREWAMSILNPFD